VNVSRISKIAGITVAGFVVASVTADKANLGPIAAHAAGFVGAFAGTLLAHVRGRRPKLDAPLEAVSHESNGRSPEPAAQSSSSDPRAEGSL
jgi:hypothetical protein